MEGAIRGVKYPRWQVTDARLPLPGLRKLFEALGAEPWTIFRFLKTRHTELGGQTALDALKAGRIETVLGVAAIQASGAFSQMVAASAGAGPALAGCAQVLKTIPAGEILRRMDETRFPAPLGAGPD